MGDMVSEDAGKTELLNAFFASVFTAQATPQEPWTLEESEKVWTKTRGNGHRPEYKKFHLNMRRNFFTVRVVEHWNKLPREVVESPSLETFKTCLDIFLCNLL
ncbi:hypothetical protein llap_9117 [Limosa lapponica baueri]|uniref:Rna-directed dna polymerase from mobile element jockey-like n=1 Tax=Limosa lapponica baueri TaxID=1758121 RepID=A0A2I0U3F1_LIMLA|nr:hypothetical protein llap_9117 [Limosa lapponica baueri]